MSLIIRRLWFRVKRTPFVRIPWVWLRHRGLDSTDIFLASYPRSGQYWLRFLLTEVLTDKTGEFDIIDRTIPKVGLHGAAAPLLPGGGRLVQTHEGYRKEYKKAIYLVRDLRDVVLSEYDHARAGHPYMTESFGSFEHYLLESLRGKVQGIPCWNDHVLSWLESPLARRGNLLVVRFEQMRCNPDETLAGILEFLGVPTPPDAIRTAIVNNSLERMRAKEDRRALRHSGREEDRHVRSGSVGGWREKLTPTHVKLIEQHAARALTLLGYPLSDGPSGKEKGEPNRSLDIVCQSGRAFESQA